MENTKLSEQLDRKPWGENTLTLRIAGNSYLVEGLSSSQFAIVMNRFGAAVSDLDSGEALNISFYQASEADLSLRPPLDEDAVIKSYPNHDSVEVVGIHFYGVLATNFALKGKVWTNKETGNDFKLAFENFFRLAVAYQVLKLGGLLLHSAGVMERGRADVFVGCSGFGKSTISRVRQDEGATVLSDDMVALKMIDGRLHAQAVPFTGDLDTWSQLDSCYPMRSLLRLHKGKVNQLSEPLTTAQTASLLMVCAPYVNADSNLTETLLENALRLGKTMPMRRLTFTPQAGVGRFLDTELG